MYYIKIITCLRFCPDYRDHTCLRRPTRRPLHDQWPKGVLPADPDDVQPMHFAHNGGQRVHPAKHFDSGTHPGGSWPLGIQCSGARGDVSGQAAGTSGRLYRPQPVWVRRCVGGANEQTPADHVVELQSLHLCVAHW